jgi:hypothetical protein
MPKFPTSCGLVFLGGSLTIHQFSAWSKIWELLSGRRSGFGQVKGAEEQGDSVNLQAVYLPLRIPGLVLGAACASTTR